MIMLPHELTDCFFVVTCSMGRAQIYLPKAFKVVDYCYLIISVCFPSLWSDWALIVLHPSLIAQTYLINTIFSVFYPCH